jgi:hypothetical protein
MGYDDVATAACPAGVDGRDAYGLVLRATAPGGCLSPLPFRRDSLQNGSWLSKHRFHAVAFPHHASDHSSEEVRPSTQWFRADALRLCPSFRFPGGLRPSVQRLLADAPARCSSDRLPEGCRPSAQRAWGECPSPLPLDRFLPTPLPAPETSRLPYPWRGCANPRQARCRVSRVASSTHHLRRLSDVRLAPHASSTLPADQRGSQLTLTAHWKPPVATACSPLDPRLRRHRLSDTNAGADRKRRRLEPRRARSEPQHPRTRDAIRAAYARPNGPSHRCCHRR